MKLIFPTMEQKQAALVYRQEHIDSFCVSHVPSFTMVRLLFHKLVRKLVCKLSPPRKINRFIRILLYST